MLLNNDQALDTSLMIQMFNGHGGPFVIVPRHPVGVRRVLVAEGHHHDGVAAWRPKRICKDLEYV